MIQTKFAEPVMQLVEYLEPGLLHAGEPFHAAGLDTGARVHPAPNLRHLSLQDVEGVHLQTEKANRRGRP
jgi:hypothetical protein